jgi:hypothetical protein
MATHARHNRIAGSMTIKPGDTVFVTKYALTGGIVQTTVCNSTMFASSIIVSWPGGMNGVATFGRDGIFLDLEAAQARVREMVAAKRKSLAKQMAKLDKIEAEGAKVKREGGGDE